MKPALKKSGGGSYFAAPSSLSFIPSGSKLLDCVLGGGWPLRRIANIVGDKSTGKTLLAIEACANFAHVYPRGDIWYNEAEGAFDLPYANALGLPKNRLELIEDCDTVEDFYNHLDGVLEEDRGRPGLYILDSLDSLSDDAEMARGIEEGSYGAQKAKKMSELFRRLTRRIKTSEVCLIIISQVRDAIGVTFGSKHTRTGGRALDFYASQVLYLAQLGAVKRTIDKVSRPVGVDIRAKCTKNKVGLPRRECDFSILFGYGVDDVASSLMWLDSIGKLGEFEDLSAVPEKRFGRKKEEGEGSKKNARIQKYVTKLADAPANDLAAIRERIDALVLEHWYRIEKEFLPTRRKYG